MTRMAKVAALHLDYASARVQVGSISTAPDGSRCWGAGAPVLDRGNGAHQLVQVLGR